MGEQQPTQQTNPPQQPIPPPEPVPPAPPPQPTSQPGDGFGRILGEITDQMKSLPERFADVLDERAPKPPEPPKVPEPPKEPVPPAPQNVKVPEAKETGKRTFADRWFGVTK